MATEVFGNYSMTMKFGGVEIGMTPQSIKKFAIIQDIDDLTPSFTFSTPDPTGLFTHIVPFDKKASQIYVDLGTGIKDAPLNSWNFRIFTRRPYSQFATGMQYEIECLLDVNKLFSPSYSRSWKTNISTVLQTIGNELGVEEYEIGPSLNYEKIVIQPNWTNAELLRHLKKRLIGISDEGAYKIFVCRRNGKTVLVAKSLKEFAQGDIVRKFIVLDQPYIDKKKGTILYPIYDHQILDKYMTYGATGIRQNDYSYFDFDNSEYKSVIEDYSSFFSLTEFFSIDREDSTDNEENNFIGRNNAFTSDFKGDVRSAYHSKIMNLSQIMISSMGAPNLIPGDMIQIIFNQGIRSGDLLSYQYGGYWMVKRIVNMATDTSKANIFLVRNGFNTDKPNNLIKAEMRKR